MTCEEEILSLGCDKVKVFVVSVKPWLQQFYKSKGYVETGVTEDWPSQAKHLLKKECYFVEFIKKLA